MEKALGGIGRRTTVLEGCPLSDCQHPKPAFRVLVPPHSYPESQAAIGKSPGGVMNGVASKCGAQGGRIQ